MIVKNSPIFPKNVHLIDCLLRWQEVCLIIAISTSFKQEKRLACLLGVRQTRRFFINFDDNQKQKVKLFFTLINDKHRHFFFCLDVNVFVIIICHQINLIFSVANSSTSVQITPTIIGKICRFVRF